MISAGRSIDLSAIFVATFRHSLSLQKTCYQRSCHTPTFVRAGSAPACAGINYGRYPSSQREWIPAFVGATVMDLSFERREKSIRTLKAVWIPPPLALTVQALSRPGVGMTVKDLSFRTKREIHNTSQGCMDSSPYGTPSVGSSQTRGRRQAEGADTVRHCLSSNWLNK